MGPALDFPVPGFLAAPHWGNRWFLGNAEDVRVTYTHTGHLCLQKGTDEVRQLVLQASPVDLHSLPKDRGVPVDAGRSYSIGLVAETQGNLRSQLVIHEFDREGNRLARLTLDNKLRGSYLAHADAVSLVLSIRAVGKGHLKVLMVEFEPNETSVEESSGVHALSRIKIDAPTADPSDDELLALALPIRQILYNKQPLSAVMNDKEALFIAERLVSGRYMLEALAVAAEFDLYAALSRSSLRKLYSYGRKTGYASHALSCINELFFRTGSQKDARTAANWRSEWDFYKDPWALLEKPDFTPSHDLQGPILHMVGKSLPETQTGYTLRTKYTVDALRSSGLSSVIAVQAAGNHPEGLDEPVETELAGTTIFEFAGPPARRSNRQAWLRNNAEQLLSLVKRVRPRALHAHSDFTNGVLATHVGEATGIPVVYESRGFWEETWLSRVSALNGWANVDHTVRMYGPPDLYMARRNNERKVRERAQRVVTLAQTMKNFILKESTGMPEAHVQLARNAVDTDDFPKDVPLDSLRSTLGIEPDEIVIGYISSMVEYEGIETLISAYKRLKKRVPQARLLLVGDGAHLEVLQGHAKRSGVNDVLFTGRVPHQEIIAYYHAIDIFVVPRRRTRVTELVTPLKPFEAFSTGRAVVLSDVAALQEISDDASPSARTFPAGDDKALASLLEELAEDPDLREGLGAAGAEWVRKHRTWESNVPTYFGVYAELQGVPS